MGAAESKPAQQEVYQPNPELDRPWRKFDWSQNEALKKKLENFSPSDTNVKEIKILVAGHVGAGKSSFINSIDSVFQGRISSRALVNTATGGDSFSFTQILKGFTIRCGEKTLSFVFEDIMGLEPAALRGSQPDDIINAVFGHVKDGYKFNVGEALTYKDEQYNHDPALSDQAFCLVYVLPADTVQFTDDRLTDKLKIIRHRISAKGGQDSDTDTALQCQVQTEHVARLLLNYLYDQTMHVGIPQVVVMTKVDEACPLVKKDLRKIYHSKKIKEKMEMCSTKTGVPLTNIFPVKNYHEEIDTDDKIDVLILKAVEQIVQIANDRLMDCENY